MDSQPFYVNDSFGLKTLKERGALHVEVVDGVDHAAWIEREHIMITYVLPHLL
jgi:hypothetical protein